MQLLIPSLVLLVAGAGAVPTNFNFKGVVPEIKAAAKGATTYGPVHIIVARASTEAAGTGVIGTLATTVQKANPGSTIEAIDYPASLAPYAPSSSAGTQATIKALNAAHQASPKSKIVMMGYSQGAHIILDAMCGGGATELASATSKSQLGKPNPPMTDEVGSQVVAIIQMGDPRAIQGTTYNKGTAKGAGMFPRTKDQMCPPATAAKVQSYCDSGDTFCDSGSSILTHLGYMQGKYPAKAAAFVQEKIGGAA